MAKPILKKGMIINTTYVPMKVVFVRDGYVWLESTKSKMMRKMSFAMLANITIAQEVINEL